jgi:hypothetical protein
MIRSSPVRFIVLFQKQIPSPGAVWPAMVILSLSMLRPPPEPEGRRKWPETAKTMVRPEGGAVWMPLTKEPAPEAFRLVTV